jgi:DNA-binding NtrC family response regulator
MSQRKKTARRSPVLPGVIFVVDDDPLLGQFAGAVLETQGCEVRIFTDPIKALQAIKKSTPKPVALVTDYDMKEMNGLDLILAAEKLCPSLKTILLSGTVDGSVILKHAAKVHHFLGKPYQPAQLKTLIGELLPGTLRRRA